MLGYDDALDAFGVHGVGGALGAMLTGAFASNAINSAAHGWLIDGNFGQMLIQLDDVGAVFIYCAVGDLHHPQGHRHDHRPARLPGGRSRRARHQSPRRNGTRLIPPYTVSLPELGRSARSAPFFRLVGGTFDHDALGAQLLGDAGVAQKRTDIDQHDGLARLGERFVDGGQGIRDAALVEFGEAVGLPGA